MAKKGKKRSKPRSAAQKRASKKNIRKAQAKRRSKKPKTKRKKGKTNKPKRKSTNMVKGGKKRFIDKIPGLKNKTVQRIGFGLGMGVLVVSAIDFIAKQGPAALSGPLVKNKRIIKLGTELATEPLSAVVDVVIEGGLNLGSLTGGNGSNGQQQQVANGGFA